MSFDYSTLLGTSNLSVDYINADTVNTNVVITKSLSITGLAPNRIVATDSSDIFSTLYMGNGSLLIGNAGSYSISNLTAGSANIIITNSPGNISIDINSSPTFITVNATNLVASLGNISHINSAVIDVTTLVANSIFTSLITISGLATAQSVIFSDSSRNLISQSMSNGSLIIGNGGSYSINTLTSGSSGNFNITNGGGSITLDVSRTPTFSTITTGSLISSAITFTGAANSILTTNGSSLVQGVSLTDGQLIIGNTSTSSYNKAQLSSGSNIVVTNGSGSISLATTPNPIFTLVTATNALINLGVQTNASFTVNNTMTTAQIQAVISNTAYSVIEFQQGSYTLTSYLNINRSNLVINGNEAILNLANGTNEPCIFIGDMSTSTPIVGYQDVFINNLFIDGNKFGQTQEASISHSWIFNNCIGIVFCSNVTIDKCTLGLARSGGFTATYNCSSIVVKNCYAYNNYFDGLTAYGSTNIRFINNTCEYNSNGAGISIDDNNFNFIIQGNNLVNNNLGVFARYCYDLVFSGNSVINNASHGLFLSGYDQNPNDQGPARWSITGNTISNNVGSGIYMQSCNDFIISGNSIYKNYNGINITSYSGAGVTYGLCSRNNITGNTITFNTSAGFYNDGSNSYTNGSRNNYLTLNILKSNTTQYTGDFSSWTIDDDLQINTNIVNTGLVVLNNSSGNYCNIEPSPGGNCTIVMPPSNGTANALLMTDGSSNSYWTNTPTVNNLAITNSANTYYLSIPATGSFTYNFILPATNGSYGYLLQTNGSGTTSWVAPSSPFSGNTVCITSVASNSTSSSSYVATSLTGTITPTSLTSIIKISVTGSALQVGSGLGLYTICRNGLDLSSSGYGFNNITSTFPTNISMNIIDSPATTSAVTYAVYFCCGGGVGSAFWNNSPVTAVLIMEEVSF